MHQSGQNARNLFTRELSSKKKQRLTIDMVCFEVGSDLFVHRRTGSTKRFWSGHSLGMLELGNFW